jgi:hypothetical protein
MIARLWRAWYRLRLWYEDWRWPVRYVAPGINLDPDHPIAREHTQTFDTSTQAMTLDELLGPDRRADPGEQAPAMRRHDPDYALSLIDHLRRVADAGTSGLHQSNQNTRGTIHNWTADALERRGWVTTRLDGYAGWYHVVVTVTNDGLIELARHEPPA